MLKDFLELNSKDSSQPSFPRKRESRETEDHPNASVLDSRLRGNDTLEVKVREDTSSHQKGNPRNDKWAAPVRFILVERSEKKAAFLRQVAAILELEQVAVVLGEFPGVVKDRKVDIVTARAVERPEKVIKGIVPFIQGGAKYLCQSGNPSGWLRGMFHVEPIVDAWTEKGFRRGTLHLVLGKGVE